MEDFSFEAIARKSVKGIFFLISRTFIVQIIGIITSFILTLYLEPASFGVFFIVSSILIFLNYFQDIGLAASLIQKKEAVTVSELRTTFTVQQLLVLTVVIPAFLFSSKIVSYYNLSFSGLFLFYALLFSFLVSSLKTIPTVIMERNLKFDKLVVPQIIENLVYNLLLAVLAIMGFGVNSFTIAIVARSIVGLIITYLVQPWSIGVSFDYQVLKRLLSFGLPFQLNSVLALFKDDLLNVYIGKLLPFSQVGYIGFSQKWAFLPLRLVMDNVIKITFPSYSRIQHHKEILARAIEKSLFVISLVIFPTIVGVSLLSSYFISFIPKYQKWEPAFISLVFFSLNTLFSSISTPLTNFLNAIGKVKITLYFMIFWTVATWVFTIIFIKLFGFNGVALASFVVSLSSIFVILISRRYVDFSLIKSTSKQFIAAFFMMIFIFLTRGIVHNLFMLFFEVVVSGIFYILILFIISRQELVNTTKFVLKSVREKE